MANSGGDSCADISLDQILSDYPIGKILNYNEWKKVCHQALLKNTRLEVTPNGLHFHYTDYHPATNSTHHPANDTSTTVVPPSNMQPVVLHVHGTPSTAAVSHQVFADHFQNKFRWLALTRPGYLQTPLQYTNSNQEQTPQQPQNFITPAEQANYFAEFIRFKKLPAVHLHAWSGGAPTALHLAAKYPELVASLTLYCAVTQPWQVSRIDPIEHLILTSKGQWLGYNLYQTQPRLFTALASYEMGISRRYSNQHPHIQKLLFLTLVSASPAALHEAGIQNDIQQMKTFHFEAWKDIRCPVLILHSESDRQVSIRHSLWAKKNLPNADFFSIPDGGHVAHLAKQGPELIQKFQNFIMSDYSNQVPPLKKKF